MKAAAGILLAAIVGVSLPAPADAQVCVAGHCYPPEGLDGVGCVWFNEGEWEWCPIRDTVHTTVSIAKDNLPRVLAAAEDAKRGAVEAKAGAAGIAASAPALVGIATASADDLPPPPDTPAAAPALLEAASRIPEPRVPDVVPEQPVPEPEGLLPELPAPGSQQTSQSTPALGIHATAGEEPEGLAAAGTGLPIRSAPPPPPSGLSVGPLVLSAMRTGPAPPSSALPPVLPSQAGGLVALIVSSLLALIPALLLFHRLDRSRLLGSERRARVLEFVHAKPGCTAADVARLLGCDYRAARHHLDLLVRFGFLARRSFGPNHRYFDNHGRYAPEEEARLAVAASPSSTRLLAAVRAQPGITQREVAERLGIAKSSVSKRVAVLERAGLVRREGRALRPWPESGPAPT